MAPSVGEKVSEVTLYSPRMKKCVFLNKNHQLLDFQQDFSVGETVHFHTCFIDF